MTLSEISVRRPVLAAVASLLILVAGLAAFLSLPLRELPDVDRPVVSIDANYRGASPEVVENAITRPIEERMAGIEGIEDIVSRSSEGRSRITVTFKLSRDLDDAAADVRDAVAGMADNLPQEVEAPEVSKADSDSQPIMWFNITSTTLSRMELSDWADRYVVDRIATLDGVARVRIGGEAEVAMRVWLDRNAMAARRLTVEDIERALRAENVELPGGQLELPGVDLSVRIERSYLQPEDFARMPIATGADGELVRLGDVARVELGPVEDRRWFRGNGVQQIGIGIIRQSKSNALEVARLAKEEMDRIRENLPDGVIIHDSYDSTVFIAESIKQVWYTLFLALGLVVAIIYLFLGSFRAAIIPAVVMPVAIAGAFAGLAVLGFSLNLMTLLALVLVIGLVVDDSIVVLENIQRRVDLGEPRLIASDRGAKQVFFAVIATSAVVLAVFAPLMFVEGYVSRLFVELAATISAAIIVSTFVALTLTPMMCSKLLKTAEDRPLPARIVDGFVRAARDSYITTLDRLLNHAWVGLLILVGSAATVGWLYTVVQKELIPEEDRGAFFVNMSGPEGASHEYSVRQMEQAEARLMQLIDSGEAFRVLVSTPGFGGTGFNSGFGIVMLNHWDERDRSAQDILRDMNAQLGEIPGARFFAGMRSPLGRGGSSNDVQFVIGGPDYDEISMWANAIVDQARTNPNLMRVRTDYEPTSPRVLVTADRERAAALGVSVQTIGRTLETMMGSRRVTRFEDRGEDYDVILQAEDAFRGSLEDLTQVYVRAAGGDVVPLSNLVTLEEQGAAADRNRLNRIRAITVSATLSDGYTLGEAVDWFEATAKAQLPPTATVELTGAAKEFRDANNAALVAFAFALLIVFLVLAGQFESFIHPFVIMLTVPLAVAGGLFGLYISGATLNIYSQIGLIILIGLAAKTGILIVEFANQTRDEGKSVREAILEASSVRFRPVLMTGLSTAIGSLPLILGDGAGNESRSAIGVVIFSGVAVATLLTLIVVPLLYNAVARFTTSPQEVERRLRAYEARHGGRVDDIAPAE